MRPKVNKLYLYDHDTKEYLTTDKPVYADSRGLHPENSTTVKPPHTEGNTVAVYNEVTGQWQTLLDKRGTTYYLNPDKPVVISAIGVDVPANGYLTKEAAEAGYTEPERIAKRTLLAKQKRLRAMATIEHNFNDGRVIEVRPPVTGYADESNIRNAIEYMEKNGIATQKWKMKDNAWYPITLAELKTALESGQEQTWLLNTAWRVAENS